MFPTIPGITILKRIGSGAYGTVYHGLTQDLRSVAVKVLEYSDAEATVRFAREARVLSELVDNRFVVDLLASDAEYDPPYIVLEYCSLGSLRDWVGESRRWQEIAGAMSHALQGLAGILRAGGFHGDIKPDNLLWTLEAGQPIVKVGDFGLARRPHPDSEPMTHGARGTIAYMAPELRRGGEFTSACDVYSLGLTGVELLVGSRQSHLLAGVECPKEFKSLLTRMVSNDADLRPDVQEIAGILEVLLQEDLNERPENREVLNPFDPAPPAKQHELVHPPSKLVTPIDLTKMRSPTNRGARPAHNQGKALPAGGVTGADLALGGLLIGGGLLGLLGLLASNANAWDTGVQRFRGADGRFKGGRFR